MRSPKSWPLLLALLGFPLIAAGAESDPFVGSFVARDGGETHRLTLFAFARGVYDGEYRVAGQRLPLEARRFGEALAGRVGIDESAVGFTLQPQGGGLLWRDRTGRHMLFRRGPSPSDGD